MREREGEKRGGRWKEQAEQETGSLKKCIWRHKVDLEDSIFITASHAFIN